MSERNQTLPFFYYCQMISTNQDMNISIKKALFASGGATMILITLAQFFRPEIKTRPVTGEIPVPANVKSIFKRACYDCHSNETRLSWIDQIAPVYWQVAKHVNTGRERLNFSEWNKLTAAEQKTKIWEAINHASLGAMPLSDYTFIHPSAKLSVSDQAILKNYLMSLVNKKPSDKSNISSASAQYRLWIHNTEPDSLPVALNGIRYDPEYKNWQSLSTSDRFESGTMRVIFGNSVAIKAVKENHTRPWPEGTRIAKALWTQITDSNGNTRTGNFVQLDLMIKDNQKYALTGGWGFARFKTLKMVPYGKTALFASECINCHRPMEKNDYVFTIPVKY